MVYGRHGRLNSKFETRFKGLIADANGFVSSVNAMTFAAWGPDTLSTPYKQGSTGYGNGFIMCLGIGTGSSGYNCQLAMAVGDTRIFTRGYVQGTYSQWTIVS